MAASLTGQFVIVKPIKKRKKTYILVFILAGIIFVAAILLIVTGSIRVHRQAEDGTSFGFSPLCDG
jgi:hypothetical protein